MRPKKFKWFTWDWNEARHWLVRCWCCSCGLVCCLKFRLVCDMVGDCGSFGFCRVCFLFLGLLRALWSSLEPEKKPARRDDIKEELIWESSTNEYNESKFFTSRTMTSKSTESPTSPLNSPRPQQWHVPSNWQWIHSTSQNNQSSMHSSKNTRKMQEKRDRFGQ